MYNHGILAREGGRLYRMKRRTNSLGVLGVLGVAFLMMISRRTARGWGWSERRSPMLQFKLSNPFRSNSEDEMRLEMARKMANDNPYTSISAGAMLTEVGNAGLEDAFLKKKYEENAFNLSVEFNGNIVGYLEPEPVFVRFYYPEVDLGMDDWRFASIRFMRKVKYQKDRLLCIANHLLHNVFLKTVKTKWVEGKAIAREQLLAYRDIALQLLQTTGDWLSKRQDYLVQGAAAVGAAAAITAALSQTLLNDEWRLMQQFVPPSDDLELEQGTMVYAQMQPQNPAGNIFGGALAQQTKPPAQVGEPKWVLCELQGRAVAGAMCQVVAYANRMQMSVPFESLRLARPEDQFLLTAMQGEPNAIMQSLENTGANVNARDIQGNTALILACEQGKHAAATALLEAGANPNIANLRGVTPLILAATRGKVDLVESLLDYGARVNKPLPDGKTALYQSVAASQMEVTEKLLSRGASPNKLNKRNFSPLFMACQIGDVNMVKLLLAHGAGWTMNVAADLGQGKATPLFMAAQKGHLPVIQALAEAGCDLDKGTLGKNKASPLMVAGQSGNGPIASYLLEMGADPDRKIADGSTALNLAIQFGNLAVAQILINGGANVDNEDSRGFTALHMATQTKQPKMVQTLLDAGADANIFSLKTRLSPLLLALYLAKQEKAAPDRVDIVRMLIQPSAATLHLSDRNGFNAFYLAITLMKKLPDETELLVDMLRASDRWGEITRRHSKSRRRARPRMHLFKACIQARRQDLLYLLKNWDPKDPDAIYQKLEDRQKYFKQLHYAKYGWREPPAEDHYPKPVEDDDEEEVLTPPEEGELPLTQRADREFKKVRMRSREFAAGALKFRKEKLSKKPSQLEAMRYWMEKDPERAEYWMKISPRFRPITKYPRVPPGRGRGGLWWMRRMVDGDQQMEEEEEYDDDPEAARERMSGEQGDDIPGDEEDENPELADDFAE